MSQSKNGKVYLCGILDGFDSALLGHSQKRTDLQIAPLSQMTRGDVRQSVFAWIEGYYNRRRRNTANQGNLAPLVKRALYAGYGAQSTAA